MKRSSVLVFCLFLIAAAIVSGTLAAGLNPITDQLGGITQTIESPPGSLAPGSVLDYFIRVTNQRPDPCYFRTVVGIECAGSADADILVPSWNEDDYTVISHGVVTLYGEHPGTYRVYSATYKRPLSGQSRADSSLQSITVSSQLTREEFQSIGKDISLLAFSQALWQETDEELLNTDTLALLGDAAEAFRNQFGQ